MLKNRVKNLGFDLDVQTLENLEFLKKYLGHKTYSKTIRAAINGTVQVLKKL